jgi:aminoglycoside phosphotransferase (APT) family kinase protein
MGGLYLLNAALDIEQPGMLLAYLRETKRIDPDEPVQLCRLAGGVSNRTVLVQRPNGQAWVIKQPLARLRVATEWHSAPRRIHREAAGLRCLARLAPPGSITPFVFEDFDHDLLAMDAVPQPHENWKAMLLAGRVKRPHVEQFAQLLSTIHREAAARCEDVAAVFGDRTFFESMRVEPYYAFTAERVPAAELFLRQLIQDCRQRRFTLVHGGYSPKNILVHDGRLVLLDHEVIHWGDGAFDAGFAMAHLLSKAHHVVDCRPALVRAAEQFWTIYWNSVRESAWSKGFETMVVRHALGCLLARVAGRSPLEYLTEDERLQQHEATVTLMLAPPTSVSMLIEAFIARL